jgi:hypothetical protein
MPIKIPMLFVIDKIIPAYGEATSCMCEWNPAGKEVRTTLEGATKRMIQQLA